VLSGWRSALRGGVEARGCGLRRSALRRGVDGSGLVCGSESLDGVSVRVQEIVQVPRDEVGTDPNVGAVGETVVHRAAPWVRVAQLLRKSDGNHVGWHHRWRGWQGH